MPKSKQTKEHSKEQHSKPMLNKCPVLSDEQITACKNDPDMKNKTAVDACNAINDPDDQTKAMATALLTALNPLSIFKSQSKSRQKMITELNSKMSDSSIIKQYSDCTQMTKQKQTNSIKGMNPSCITSLAAAGFTPYEIKDMMARNKISDVVQQNTANAENTCKIDLVLDILSKMTSSIDNSALQSAVNSAKGIASDANSEQDMCTKISTEMSACKYIQQQQCCAQNVSQLQKNLLDTGCQPGDINNVVQTNNANALNTCILSSKTSVTSDMAAAIKNTVSQSAKNTAEGLTFNFAMIILIIILLLIGLPMFVGGKIVQKFIEFLSYILFAAGIFCICYFFYYTIPENTKYNDPILLYTGAKYLEQPVRSTFGEAKTRVQKNDVIGYDFFIDVGDDGAKSKTPKDPKTISDDQNGSAAYLTIIPKPDAVHSSFDSTKMSTVSFTKQLRNIILLVFGIILILLGVCLFIYNYLNKPNTPKGYRKIKKEKDNRKTDIELMTTSKEAAPAPAPSAAPAPSVAPAPSTAPSTGG